MIWARRRAATLLLTLGIGCGSQSSEVAGPDEPGPPKLPVLGQLIVSNPAPGAIQGALAQADAGDTGSVVFVSLAPGTIPEGRQATLRTAGQEAVTVPMRNGGWDPVAIQAGPGDTLRVSISSDTGVGEFIAPVPRRKGPIIVRTDPPPQKRDVPLNTTLLVVFSEPMDPRTIGPSTIQLLRNGVPVAGTVTLRGAEPWIAEVLPGTLDPGTTYQLLITGQVADQDADNLESPLGVAFTTVTAPPALSGLIAFAKDTSGNRQIFVLDLGDLSRRQLTSGAGTRNHPVWSPDGSQIAFTLGHDRWWDAGRNQAVIVGEVYLMNADGTGLRKLADGYSPTWSRDSTGRIAYVNDGRIEIVNADGSGAARSIALPLFDIDLNGLSWSPDGRSFVFHASHENGYLVPLMQWEMETVVMINADGSNIRRVTSSCSYHICGFFSAEASPSWSPDGSTLAYWSWQFGLTVIAPAGGPAGSLGHHTTWDAHLAWSPDGAWIAFPTSALNIVPAAGLAAPVPLPGTFGALHPSWTR